MDNKDKTDASEEESTHNEDKTTKCPAKNYTQSEDDAGPSGAPDLPGAVTKSPRISIHKPGLSKSEHSIRQIITDKDVAKALKLTSMSYATTNPILKNLNMKEVKIPIPKELSSDKSETGNVAIKSLVTGCFKFNKETVNVPEVPFSIHTAISTITNEMIQDIPNSSCINSNIQTERPMVKANEVIVTNNLIEPKISKADSKGKKTSGSLSERSDLALAQADSLSSIGSMVCRICMTRGRER